MEIYNGKWKVYIHTNKINNKMYIGITSTKPQKRWGENGSGYKGCIKFYNAINKYGWDNFDHEIFASNLTFEEACSMQKLLISKLDTINNGYNVKEGGNGGPIPQEVRIKIREKRAHQVITKEAIQKMAATHRGTHHTEETIQKMRQAASVRGTHVRCIETDEVFMSIAQAARYFNVTTSAIKSSCQRAKSQNKKRNTGYHFEYAQ